MSKILLVQNKKTELTADMLRRKAKELQNEHMHAWEVLHQMVRDTGMPGGDLIFFEYPIKSPSLEVYDNIEMIIENMIEHLEKEPKCDQ